jgi:ribosome-associated protein
LQSSELLDFVVEKIDDMKGRDVVKLDVQKKSTITDYMVVCSGNSKRHVQSIGETVYLEAKNNGINIIGMEGKQFGEWVLVDLGGVIVHVMQESTRDFYQLEKLWTE